VNSTNIPDEVKKTMQEKVVYFLGAGFSAPMGLPVMNNFLIHSKDLYLSNPDKYHHFGEVFKTIDAMHRAKSHYNVDLFNIEEILSLLEMKYYVTDSGDRELFIDYLQDVIKALTPPAPAPQKPVPYSKGDWPRYLFGGTGTGGGWRAYCSFVAALFNLVIQINVSKEKSPLKLDKEEAPPVQYSVISLNYDLVLERCLDLILHQCDTRPDVSFARTCKEAEMPGRVPLAKLHGSVDSTIVPPTWNKVAQPKEIQKAWKLAYKVLSEATQIRILGYSLPQTDSYVRYLLESATMEDPHRKNLKNIDVICLDDPNGSVQGRYEEFLCFYRRRFTKLDITSYLWDNWEQVTTRFYREGPVHIVRFNKLEGVHRLSQR
jgi:hypothetical protein